MALWEMEPDQWFRMWTTIGTAVGGGLTTLVGGFFGYRLALRVDRRKQLAEVLRAWESEFESFERELDESHDRVQTAAVLASYSSKGDRAGKVGEFRLTEGVRLLEEWGARVERRPPQFGSAPNVVALEMLAAWVRWSQSLMRRSALSGRRCRR